MTDHAWRDAALIPLGVAVVELAIGLATGSWAGLWFLAGAIVATPLVVLVRRRRYRRTAE